jgi:hypothetical protein
MEPMDPMEPGAHHTPRSDDGVVPGPPRTLRAADATGEAPMDTDELHERLATIDAEWYATLEQLHAIDVEQLRDELDSLTASAYSDPDADA